MPLQVSYLPYVEIKSIHSAIFSFAAQLVQNQLHKEADCAVRLGNGSSVFSKTEGGYDMGIMTVSNLRDSIKEHQPLLNMALHNNDCNCHGLQVN